MFSTSSISADCSKGQTTLSICLINFVSCFRSTFLKTCRILESAYSCWNKTGENFLFFFKAHFYQCYESIEAGLCSQWDFYSSFLPSLGTDNKSSFHKNAQFRQLMHSWKFLAFKMHISSKLVHPCHGHWSAMDLRAAETYRRRSWWHYL